MVVASTPAYYNMTTIMASKRFMTVAPDLVANIDDALKA
jgi:hypothetical protein